MSKFRKKPVIVEARQWDGADAEGMNAWASDVRIRFNQSQDQVLHFTMLETMPVQVKLEIQTPSGRMIAAVDDWIVCGQNGEIYPVKPDAFASTYEPVG